MGAVSSASERDSSNDEKGNDAEHMPTMPPKLTKSKTDDRHNFRKRLTKAETLPPPKRLFLNENVSPDMSEVKLLFSFYKEVEDTIKKVHTINR